MSFVMYLLVILGYEPYLRWLKNLLYFTWNQQKDRKILILQRIVEKKLKKKFPMMDLIIILISYNELKELKKKKKKDCNAHW